MPDAKNDPIFEQDRITDGFDIFFWEFNDKSSFVATHWHTAIEMMYIIDGEVDVTMNHQTTVLLARRYLSDRLTAPTFDKINPWKPCSFTAVSISVFTEIYPGRRLLCVWF